MLSAALGDRVELAYAATGEPRVADAVSALRDAGARRVVVASYLLADGLFQDRLRESGADAVADPLGSHPGVLRLIANRFPAAHGTPPVRRRLRAGAGGGCRESRRCRECGPYVRVSANSRAVSPTLVEERGLRADLDHAGRGHAGPVHRQGHVRRVEALPVRQRERLLLDGRLHRAGPPGPRRCRATSPRRRRTGRCCRRRAAAVVETEQRHLRPSGSSTPTPRHGIRRSYAQAAIQTSRVSSSSVIRLLSLHFGMPMGTLRPDRRSNSTVGSASSGALTNDTNRDSFSGSSSTPFHSHA